jgi:hypothetical protein
VDPDIFNLIAELELRQAIRLQYYVSVLAVHADADHAPGPTSPEFQRRIADVIRAEMRGTDVVSVMPVPPYIQVLLVSAHLYDLPKIIDRMAGAMPEDGGGREGGERVILSVGGACFPTTARGLRELLRQATVLSDQARASGLAGHRYRLAEAAP